MNKYIEIGARLRMVRGKTRQADFAEALGVALLTYQRYERGERMPSGEALTKAAELGQTTIDWILTGKDNATKKRGFFLAEDSAEYEVIKMMRAMPRSKAGMARSILKAMTEKKKKNNKKRE